MTSIPDGCVLPPAKFHSSIQRAQHRASLPIMCLVSPTATVDDVPDLRRTAVFVRKYPTPLGICSKVPQDGHMHAPCSPVRFLALSAYRHAS